MKLPIKSFNWNCLTTRLGLQTMIGLLKVPERASVPDLLMAVASAHEFSSIKLRRGEKKILNAINKSFSDETIRFCVPRPENHDKAKERISTGAEKIFILVHFNRIPSRLADDSNLLMEYVVFPLQESTELFWGKKSWSPI